jgi:DNA-nicking Smr family endonuclease
VKLHELAQVKKQLQTQAAQRAAHEAAHQAQQAKALAERELFARAVGAKDGRITPLAPSNRALLGKDPPQPVALQQQRDEQAVLSESLSDEFDVESLLDTDESLSFRRPGIGVDVVRKLRKGHWSVQAQLDLHGLRQDEAREALAAFVREAVLQGLRCVRVVHGKGLGSPGKTPVLKGKVQSWLIQKNEVLAFVQARPAQGGAGAVVVLLKASL